MMNRCSPYVEVTQFLIEAIVPCVLCNVHPIIEVLNTKNNVVFNAENYFGNSNSNGFYSCRLYNICINLDIATVEEDLQKNITISDNSCNSFSAEKK